VPIRYLFACTGTVSGLLLLSLHVQSQPADAGDTNLPAPKLATLHGQYRLSAALADIARQIGEPVADQMGDADPQLDLDLQNVSFWEALDALADKAHARVDLHPREGHVALTPRPAGWRPPPVSHSGLFRVALHDLTAKLDLETGGRACTASVEVAWEPHLLPLLLETRPRSLAVRDDAGRVAPAGPATNSLAPVDGRTSLAFDVALPPVDRSAKTLALVEGELYAVAPTKMLTFSFGLLAALAGAPADDARLRQTQEGVSCRVGKVTAEDDRWSVEIVLDYPDGNVKLDSYQSWVVNNEITLERADGGDRFSSATYLLEESTPRHAVLTYNFSDKGRMKRGLAEWKLVYTTPARVVKVPIHFAFHDVPLP